MRIGNTSTRATDPELLRYLTLTAAGDISQHAVTDARSLDAIQGAVSGYIELIPVPDPTLAVFVNEEGSMRGLPPSYVGTAMLRALGSPAYFPGGYVLGTVVIIGRDRVDHIGLTDAQLAALADMHQRITGATASPREPMI